jgi:hypothetical protein
MSGHDGLDPSKPLLFVAMPFGERREPDGTRMIDFDSLYRECIVPCVKDAGVEVIRADEETLGGFIHRPMYERLLLAEIVIADLTFANPNVFYELGVRHAARPRSTILIYADLGTQPPFDVAAVRGVPYQVSDTGGLAEPTSLAEELARRLALAQEAESVDSPIFQLLSDYPGVDLPHEVTDAFKARARLVSELTIRAYEAASPDADRGAAIAELAAVKDRALALPEPEEQLLVSLLLAYRDIEAWPEMVELIDEMPSRLAAVVTVRQQLALALNRRNSGADRANAIQIAEGLLAEHGVSAETCGILGRCHKDRWREKKQAGDPGAADSLDVAIDAYTQGFDADPRDFYPGINLLALLLNRGRPADLDRVEDLVPVVRFAIARRRGLASGDYWTLATLLALAAMSDDRSLGERALSAIFDTSPHAWMRETTAVDLQELRDKLEPIRDSVEWVDLAIRRLRAGSMEPPS